MLLPFTFFTCYFFTKRTFSYLYSIMRLLFGSLSLHTVAQRIKTFFSVNTKIQKL